MRLFLVFVSFSVAVLPPAPLTLSSKRPRVTVPSHPEGTHSK